MGAENSPPSVSSLLLLLLLLLLPAAQCGVTYDRKAIVINGQRRNLISSSIHYPRSTPDMWEGLMQKAKDGGLDVIQTYVFWNGHEPSPGNVRLLMSFLFFFLILLFFSRILGAVFLDLLSWDLEWEYICLRTQYNFEGNYDLVRFIKTVQKAGLYVHLRIGPYICGE